MLDTGKPGGGEGGGYQSTVGRLCEVRVLGELVPRHDLR